MPPRPRPRYRDRDVWPDNRKEWVAWLVFVAVILSLVTLSITDPYYLQELSIPGSSSGFEASGSYESGAEPLYLSPADAFYMSRIFEERDHEIGYCAIVDGRHLEPHLADTVSASDESLQFSTANCPSEPPGTIHTHPNGNLGLSLQDRSNALARGQEFTCIQAGRITADPLQQVETVACYDPVATGDGYNWTRIPVVVTDQVT